MVDGASCLRVQYEALSVVAEISLVVLRFDEQGQRRTFELLGKIHESVTEQTPGVDASLAEELALETFVFEAALSEVCHVRCALVECCRDLAKDRLSAIMVDLTTVSEYHRLSATDLDSGRVSSFYLLESTIDNLLDEERESQVRLAHVRIGNRALFRHILLSDQLEQLDEAVIELQEQLAAKR